MTEGPSVAGRAAVSGDLVGAIVRAGVGDAIDIARGLPPWFGKAPDGLREQAELAGDAAAWLVEALSADQAAIEQRLREAIAEAAAAATSGSQRARGNYLRREARSSEDAHTLRIGSSISA
jgi:hypothetical protein